MIVDSSAIVAVLVQEPGYEPVLDVLVETATAGAGTPTLVETGIVLARKLGPAGRGTLGRFIDEYEVVAVPFGDEHWREAVSAYARYGRGHHAASLNFGDCMTYAVAKLAGEPVLCLGDDFARTDLSLALG